MNLRLSNLYFIFSVEAFLLLACTHDPINIDVSKISTCNPDTVYFVNDVLPLLQSSCAQSGCHDAHTAEHDVVLDNYENILKTSEVKKGRAAKSKLYKVLIDKGDDIMPPVNHGGPWDNSKIGLIKNWIDQGALNNQCKNNKCDTASVSFSSDIKPILASYCLGCHSYPNPQGSISLNGYNEVLEQVNKKRLLGSLRHKYGFFAMPKNMDKLSDCELRKIAVWIQNGVLNN